MKINRVLLADLLAKARQEAIERARLRWGVTLPEACLYEFHGYGKSGGLFTEEEVCDALIRKDGELAQIIDIVLVGYTKSSSILFVRPGGRAVTEYGDTFDPEHRGPFRQLEAVNLSFRDAK